MLKRQKEVVIKDGYPLIAYIPSRHLEIVDIAIRSPVYWSGGHAMGSIKIATRNEAEARDA